MKLFKLFSILIIFSLAMGCYEASAKVKLKEQKSVVDVSDFTVTITADLDPVAQPEFPNLSKDAILPEGVELKLMQVYGGRYLHRSKAWLRNNNLYINSVVNTFGISTESCYSQLVC